MHQKTIRNNPKVKRETVPSSSGGIRDQRSGGRDAAVALFLAGDSLAALLGLLLAYWLRFHSGILPTYIPGLTEPFDPSKIQLAAYSRLIALGAVLLIGTFLNAGLYSERNLMRFRKSAAIIVRGALFWFVAYLSFSLVVKFQPQISRFYVLTSLITTVTFLLIWRRTVHGLLKLDIFASALRQNILVVGWTNDVANLFDAIQSDRSHPYRLAGVILPPGRDYKLAPPPGVSRLGSFNELSRIMSETKADIVVLGDMEISAEQILEVANLCERQLVQFKIVPNYFEILVSGLQLETISGVPIMGVSELPLDRLLNRILKRSVDIAGALVGLFLSTPIFLIFGCLIYIESPGTIFFGQERVGRSGRRFRMFKLRSMVIGADSKDNQSQSTLRSDPRVLRIGSFIRRWNLDETPQFWNVLTGEMSLVGPRPERTYHSERLSFEIPHYNARLASKPGMTGWAQVNGLRGDTSLVERVRYDLFYLENWSLWLDFQIMIQTFFRRKNAY